MELTLLIHGGPPRPRPHRTLGHYSTLSSNDRKAAGVEEFGSDSPATHAAWNSRNHSTSRWHRAHVATCCCTNASSSPSSVPLTSHGNNTSATLWAAGSNCSTRPVTSPPRRPVCVRSCVLRLRRRSYRALMPLAGLKSGASIVNRFDGAIFHPDRD